MENINDILAKHFSGEITPEEANLVAEWKAQHEEEYAVLSEAWEVADVDLLGNLEFKEFDHKAAWNNVDARLVDEKEIKVIKMRFYKRVAAACAILLVGLAGFWFLNSGTGYNSVTNMAGTPKEISLPDGSTVWLASNSTLNYKTDFTNERSLTLDGEAFFEVAPDKAHPFIVSTEMGEVEVLGTAFNVDANTQSTIVSVDHGRVALRNENKQVELTAGESANSIQGNVSEKEDADVNFKAWKTGVFYFNETPLVEVVEHLNKHYEKEIILENITENNDHVNGLFDNRPIEEIIEVIVLTCDVEDDHGDNVIRLK